MLNPEIILYKEPRKFNTKASEEYVHVKFKYSDVGEEWDGWVPVEYRRTGVSIAEDDKETLENYLNGIYIQMHPFNYAEWLEKQERLWNTKKQ